MELTRENPGGKADNGCAFRNTVITEVRVTVSDVLSHSIVLGTVYGPKWSIWILGTVAHLGQQTRTQDTHSEIRVEREKIQDSDLIILRCQCWKSIHKFLIIKNSHTVIITLPLSYKQYIGNKGGEPNSGC